ncbi:D-glucuronyl C5-epimerase family protein [Shewanella sp.]|uniref:D-glucuronyl C5-epimerase family protein n=1 Tax=Shewanella sp. TaxID=50422 RepID=UPI003561297E
MSSLIKKLYSHFQQDDYWHGRQGVGKYYSIAKLSGYYNDLTKKIVSKEDIDIEKIIPKVTVKGEKFIHPVTVCQVGLGAFDLYLETNEKVHLDQAIECGNWLVTNVEVGKNNTSYWTIPYDFKLFNMRKGFVSGLVQGQAISLLLRLYITLDDKQYYDLSLCAFNKLIEPVSIGGCRCENSYIYEEYPNTKEINLVLNGAISAFWGIYDLSLVSNEPNIKKIMTDSMRDLVLYLPKYDMNFYSRYCLKKSTFYYHNVASPYYHAEHIAQLKVLVDMTNSDPVVLKILSSFNAYNTKLNSFVSKLIKAYSLIVQKLLGLR